jgi:hypothetical protein
VNPVKMLGLAAIAAVAMIAFIGVSSASAVHLVVVCLEDPTGLCPKGKLKEAGAGLPILGLLEPLGPPGAEEVHTVFLGAVKELCAYSDIKGEITKSSPLHGLITAIEFGDCTPCSHILALNLPYLVKFHHDLAGAHLWLMLVEQTSAQKPILVDVEGCPFGMKCGYKAEKLHLSVANTASGLPLVLSLDTPLVRHSGSSLFCGAEGKWDANYLVEILHGDLKEKGWLALDENEA